MVQDPYQVLGVSRSAAADEIKRAYRKKAKEYHPDLHPDDPSASGKMKEVNEAYDMLRNPEKYEAQRKRQQTSSEGARTYRSEYRGYENGNRAENRYRDPGGWSSDFGGFDFEELFNFGFGGARYDAAPKAQPGDTAQLISAINAVNSRSYREAIEILSGMTSQYRNARWYYVSAVAHRGLGDTARAQELIGRAVKMEPDNKVYSQLYREYRQEEREQSDNSDATVLSPLRMIGRFALALLAIRFFMGLLQTLFYGIQYIH